MMIKRTREEVTALEGELLCDGCHRLTLIDGTVVDCVAIEVGRGVAHVFTSRGVRTKYRYAEICRAGARRREADRWARRSDEVGGDARRLEREASRGAGSSSEWIFVRARRSVG